MIWIEKSEITTLLIGWKQPFIIEGQKKYRRRPCTDTRKSALKGRGILFSLSTWTNDHSHWLPLEGDKKVCGKNQTNTPFRWLPLREQKNFFAEMVKFLSFPLATTWEGKLFCDKTQQNGFLTGYHLRGNEINGGDAYALLMTCRRSLNGGK